MSISYEGPDCMHEDDQSALTNNTEPESVLKKKSSSLDYHLIREREAMDNWRTANVNTHDNEADLPT